MGGGATPSVDFKGAAQKDVQANRPNVNSDFGSGKWSQDANGNWTLDQRMDPAMGGLLSQGLNNFQQPFDWSQFGQAENGNQARKEAFDSAYGQSASRLDPQWKQSEEEKRSQLYAQGLSPQDAAFQQEMGNFSRSKNDAYQGARNSAIQGSTQAGALAFQQNNMARQQRIADALRQRGLPLEELGQVLGLSGGLKMPGTPGVGNPNSQAANQNYQQQMDAYNAENAKEQSMMSGGMSLLSLLKLFGGGA